MEGLLTDEKLGKLDGKLPDQQQLLENKIEDKSPGILTSVKLEESSEGGNHIASSGSSWQALHNGQVVAVARHPSLYRLFDAVTLCNNATLGDNGNALGLPTEAALLLASHRLGWSLSIHTYPDPTL